MERLAEEPQDQGLDRKASDACQGQRAGLKAKGTLRLLDAYQVPCGLHLIVSLSSHYEKQIETSSKIGSNSNVDRRELDMSPQTKCRGRRGGNGEWDPTSPLSWSRTHLLGCQVASSECIKQGHWWRVSASHQTHLQHRTKSRSSALC